jgi:hypothetical protein
VFTCCSGFLLDDRTQPQTTTIPTLSDKHFNMLFDILVDEKRSRLRLEECVVKLENELHLIGTDNNLNHVYVSAFKIII